VKSVSSSDFITAEEDGHQNLQHSGSTGAMNDVAVNVGSAEADAQERPAASTTNELQIPSGKLTDRVAEGADGDSEAETLIESPEKKKQNIIDAAPRLPAVVPTFTADQAQDKVPASESKTRKRKRPTAELEEDATASQKSSRRSSPLSSSQPHRSDDSDTDASEKRTLRVRNGGHGSDQENTRRIQLRRRRPSDIVPGGSGGADGGRRETRSATYPRHSSADRSVSPKREHRRVASTQIGRRSRPMNINTKRSSSSDRHSSSSSSSPPRTRPQLHKHTSVDHDMMSPAKAAGPRKHTDKNGRTYLARACNNNDLSAVRARFLERPQDLNIADHALNTPLQIAALEGSVDIVKFLLEKNCDVDTRNVEKDTPLIDAVENGHLEVVRLLLEFGANPRLGNQHGDEPYELAKVDGPDFDEIRKLITDAKENPKKRRKIPDDQADHDGSSRAASAASLRDSPPLLGPRSPQAATTNRRRTGRSESTRNDLLWQANTQENLARLAGKGDVQGVASILNILTKADTEAVIAAAKAGHEEVLQLLMGMGDPDPDPDPIRSVDLKPGFNTPMLAAIGRGNPDVIQLLVNQSEFDPTRLWQGNKYYELSQERKGADWQKEYNILKTAYDQHTAGKSRKHGSPRKPRDLEKEKPRRKRESSSPVAVHARGQMQSPSQSHKSLPGKDSAEKYRRPLTRERIPADRGVAVSSDHEPVEPRKTHKTRRSQSDLPTLDVDALAASQKRRRLVTGKEHRSGKEHRKRRPFISDESSEESEEDNSAKLPHVGSGGVSVGRARENKNKRRAVPESSSPEASRPTPRKKVLRKPSGESLEVMQGVEPKPLSDIEEISKHQHSTSQASKSMVEPPQAHVPAETSASMQTGDGQLKGEVADVVADALVKSEANALDSVEHGGTSDKPMKDITPSVSQPETSVDVEITEAPPLEDAPEDPAVLEERREQEEASRKAAEEAAEEAGKAEEVAAKKRAEEEAAARKKEDEERRERFKREAEERQRRLDEQKRREFLEQERLRREALPSLLCKCAYLLDQNDASVKSQRWLAKFLPLFTVKTRQLDASCPSELQEEEWIANFQVAGLLAIKDLNLRQYTSLEKRPVNDQERDALWKVARNMLAFDYDANAFNTTIEQALEREMHARPRFYAMAERGELCWVKLSDFEEQIFRHPHLTGLHLKKQRISVQPARFAPLFQQQPVKPASPPLVNGVSPYMSNVPSANGVLQNGTMHGHGHGFFPR
jgi:hypothetical protein